MTHFPHKSLTNATLEWKDGVPCSHHFDDVYFSREGGADETNYVFINGNKLTERFKYAPMFTIIETGFGTGLNFLVTASLWLEIAPKDAVLHFISTEKFPLSLDDLKQAHSHFPQFKELCTAMQAFYPPVNKGFHRIGCTDGRIQLTLLYGDISDTLPQLDATADAWFLDGFSPAKNPEMWSESVFKQISRLSKADTTAATYSCAAVVRNGLKNAGFDIQKTKGFGRKRDMLTATYVNQPARANTKTPWFNIANPYTPTKKHAAVIGGGLAGCFAAYSLARRGFNVTIIERHSRLCEGASGNPAGIMQPSFSAPQYIGGRFYLAAFLYNLQHIKRHKLTFHQTGALHLTGKRVNQSCIIPDSMMEFIVAEDVHQKCGIPLLNDMDAIFLPDAGWVNPHQFATETLALVSDKVTTVLYTEAIHLLRENNIWHICDKNKHVIEKSEIVIIANAYDTHQFTHTQSLPIELMRGQLTYLPQSKKTEALSTIICHAKGHILPQNKNTLIIGATYDNEVFNTENLLLSHEKNIKEYGSIVETYTYNTSTLEGRTSFRAVTPDHLPIVGPVPDFESFENTYQAISDGTKRGYPDGIFHPGLYISAGHGSRGLLSCSLAAEILANHITQEPLVVEKSILDAIHPARFCIRNLKRRKT